MNPFMLPMVLGGAQALIGGIGTLFNKRPTYEIPSAATQSLKTAQIASVSNMPDYDQSITNVNTNAANAATAARESGNPLSVLGQIQANANAGVNNVDAQNAQYRAQQSQRLQQAQSEYAQYQDQAFQLNEFAPYADRQKQFGDLFGAGLKNIGGGADSLMMQKYLDSMRSPFGTQGNSTLVNPLPKLAPKEITNMMTIPIVTAPKIPQFPFPTQGNGGADGFFYKKQ